LSRYFSAANGLKGQLPGELGDLLDMDHLSLFDNEISGSFPDRMRYLADLDFLNVATNQMSGKLPTWINSWTQLEFLGLGDNQFTGPVPDLSGLDYLIELAVDGNQLTGSIDAFGKAPFLQSLFINDNNFTGSFGDDTWDGLDDLTTIDISTNEGITGTVPQWVYYLDSVDLHDNFLDQTLQQISDPASSPLKFFSVYGNDIKGPIPSTLGDLRELTHLDLGDNYFTGTIPDEFFYLETLEKLYLTDNDLFKQEFPDLSDCTRLTELGLGDAKLTGTIPMWVGARLQDLAVLDLRDNFLTGTIPVNLSYLENLEILMVNYNDLEGDVPNFSGCEFLRTYLMHYSSLCYHSPVSFFALFCRQKFFSSTITDTRCKMERQSP
jgi:Leucine-rich repeat (LRR) protein